MCPGDNTIDRELQIFPNLLVANAGLGRGVRVIKLFYANCLEFQQNNEKRSKQK